MKKRSVLQQSKTYQLHFEWVISRPGNPDDKATSTSSAPAPNEPKPCVVVNLTRLLNRRAAEEERSLLKAIENRAAHLSDCLLK